MRVVIWMNIPSHHQANFFEALRQAGVDLLVRYYAPQILEERLLQGWCQKELCKGEAIVQPTLEALESLPDYKDRIHVIPGYGTRFLRQLAAHLSQQSVEWVHWSECSQPGMRWFLGYPRKCNYGKLVARYALGAFAQGILAENDFVRWGIPIEKIARLYYAVKGGDRIVANASQCQNALQGRNAFLYLGRLYKRKAIDILLRSFAAIAHNNRKKWVLLVVGSDKFDGRYKKLASKLGLDEEVFFIDPIPSDQIWSVLKSAKVLVLPSRHDGWGVVLNEAASMGLALIGSSNAGATHHLVSPGINGFRVRAGNVDSLRAALLAYVHNSELAEKHGEASLTIAKEFTPERNVQRFLTAIESWRSMKGAQ